MKVKIIRHNGFECISTDYIEFSLGTFLFTDIVDVCKSQFSDVGEGCSLCIKFYPEDDIDKEILRSFQWQGNNHFKDCYFIPTGCPMVAGVPVPIISENCYKDICNSLFRDYCFYKDKRGL